MSCQARKKKSPRFLWCTRLPCEQLGKLTSGPGSSLPGSRRRGFPGESAGLACSQVGAPPLPTPHPPPPAPAPCAPSAPGRPHPHHAPPGAGCKGAAQRAFQLKMPPSLSFPCLGSLSLEVARARSRGPSWGGKSGRILSPCCVTLESFPALSGRGSHKWKCEANQTRCDYF